MPAELVATQRCAKRKTAKEERALRSHEEVIASFAQVALSDYLDDLDARPMGEAPNTVLKLHEDRALAEALELQHVTFLKVSHAVAVSLARSESEGVVPAAAQEDVVSQAALDGVLAAAASQNVVAPVADQDGVPAVCSVTFSTFRSARYRSSVV